MRVRRLVTWGLVVTSVLVCDGGLLLFKWPFRRDKIIQGLEKTLESRVRMRSFQAVFFPSPGFIAEGTSIGRQDNGKEVELATVRRIECRENWSSLVLLRHRVSKLLVQGLHVAVPTHVPPPMHFPSGGMPPSTVVELIANGSVLEIASRNDGGQPLRFIFPKLVLQNVAKEHGLRLETVLKSANPPGELFVKADFGPLQTKKPGSTPISGTFHFTKADLSQYQVIGGLLSSSGGFRGTLGHAEVDGSAVIDNFEVSSSRHPFGLSSEFETIVNGTNGDVSIQKVGAHFLQTSVLGQGSITATANKPGKTLDLDLQGGRARIEDLLWMFVTQTHAPLTGGIDFHAHVTLPPGEDEFLQRVKIRSDFSIRGAKFTHAATQDNVDQMSERARGKKHRNEPASDAPPVLSDLAAKASVRDGKAYLSNASFRVPGALARGHGMFNLKSEQVDFHGRLAIQTSLSKAAGGLKSILLIPFDPYFRQKHAGAVLPFRISGTYSHPSFRLSLTAK